MTDRIPKAVVICAALAGALALVFLAYERPGYFVNLRNLAGLLFLELLLAAVWMYRKVYFAVTIVVFTLAGTNLPGVAAWNVARWAVLGLGALVGTAMMLKERRYEFGLFHLTAAFALLAALVSAAVSHYTVVSSLKVLSLVLLFTYASTGVRLAVVGREGRFFSGLLVGCELFVAVVTVLHFSGRDIMGNFNSLGAVMGVVAAPILLWGTLLKQEAFAHRRHVVFFAISMYLVLISQARAGILAAFLSCGLLCLGLRKYALLMQGVGIIAILTATTAIVQPEAFSRTVSALTADVVFKGKDPEKGILSSRMSPWQNAVDSIKEHFWFGTGFGTSDKGEEVGAVGPIFTGGRTSSEHGSSYLAITEWVGIIGIFPFILLLGILLVKVGQAVRWMWRTGNPASGAVPLAMVMIAGIVHAGFEDWLFAPGYHLCIFYWSMAFVLVDQVLALNPASSYSAISWNPRVARPQLNSVVPLQ